MTGAQIAEKKLAMRKTSNAEQIARKELSERKTGELIRDFVLTNTLSDPNVPVIRGWIMDELEKRNPVAFEAWLNQDMPDERQLGLFYRFWARDNGCGWAVWYGREPVRAVPDREAAVLEIMRLAEKG